MKKFFAYILAVAIMFSISANVVYATPPCNDTNGLADALYDFGLFNGTGTDAEGKPIYSLERSSTRQEAVVMLIRLLGKEDVALQCNTKHPFTDVDAWADKYISYAYAENIAKGTSPTLFGANQSVNAQQYLTFLLRALGYDDSKGDFSYNDVYAFSDSIGLTNGVYSLSEPFLRSDVVWLSSSALLQPTKQGNPLIKQLKKDKVVSQEQYINGLSDMMYADLMEDFRYVTLYGDGSDVLEIDVYSLYAEAGQGEYAGYSRLRGYGYDNEYPIYFKGSMGSFSYVTDHNDNLNDICTWTYNGNTYRNTRKDCYAFFSDTTFFQSYYSSFSNSVLSINWFKDTFGKIYDEWFSYMAFESGNTRKLVERYLEMQAGIYYHEPLGGAYPETYFDLFDFEEAWTEQELGAEWIGEYELQELSGEADLCFGMMTSSLGNWSNGVGNLVYGFYLQGMSSEEVMFIYDMPEEFAKSESNEGTFSNIRFKIKDGEWYFNPTDLISVGLLKEDGKFNENFKFQEYDYNKAKKEYANEWITDDEIETIYDLRADWFGEEVWIYRNAYDEENGIKHIITGAPSSKFEKDKIYKGKYKSKTIRFKYHDHGYSGGIAFNYKDLVDAGIIEE